MNERPALQAHFQVRVPGFRLDFRLSAGPELVVIFGPSGSGKTLTLRALAGLECPQQGRVTLQGKVLFDSRRRVYLPPQSRRIGYVPQNYALFPHLTIAENIAYGLQRVPRAERQSRVRQLLRRMRLEGLADRKPAQVSGGQQQRAALARALAAGPELLLMDEPFSALEGSLREALRDDLRQLQLRTAIPTLLVTHNLAEAYSLADRLLVLIDGRVAQDGTRWEIFQHPATPTVARLVEMTNLLTATPLGSAETRGIVVDWEGIRLQINDRAALQAAGDLCLGVRPEMIRLGALNGEAPLEAMGPNVMQALVTGVQERGVDARVHLVVLPEGNPRRQLQARLSQPDVERLEITPGRRLRLTIPPDAIHVFRNHTQPRA